MFQRILVPLDGSRRSAQALPYAMEMARRFASQVVLMRVVPPPAFDSVTRLAGEIPMEQTRRREKVAVDRATQYLKEKLQSVEAHGIKGCFLVLVGDPAGSILGCCKKEGVGLVIMTTTGKGGLRRAIMGSVADVVVRRSGIPVLTIRQTRRKT